MGKKSYRPTSTPTTRPTYPRLVDVNRRSMVDLGLLAVGAVWLGSIGCQNPVGAAEAGETKTKPAHAKGKAHKQNPTSAKEFRVMGRLAAPELPGPEGDVALGFARSGEAQTPPDAGIVPPPGEPPLPRVDRPQADQHSNAKRGPSTGTAKPEPKRLGGAPMPPRVLEAPEGKDKAAAQSKRDKKARAKTDKP
jgi:hypothetical protein